MNPLQLKILDPRIGSTWPIPAYATAGSAGLDLRACIASDTVIAPGESMMVNTGIAIYIANPQYAGIVLPRSGLGSKHGIVLGNLVGLIDSDYQGELMVCLWNRSNTAFTLVPGERIAQYVLIPVLQCQFNVVSAFDSVSDRGSGGFGHTGQQ